MCWIDFNYFVECPLTDCRIHRWDAVTNAYFANVSFFIHHVNFNGRCLGILCATWVFWAYTALLILQQQWSLHDWLSKLLLWLGNTGLLPCFNGGLLCIGGHLCYCICYPRHRLRLPGSYHGHPKDLAEALSHPHQEGAHQGKNTDLLLILMV